jgi:hypothetical protein
VDLLVVVEIDGALLLGRERSSSTARWGEDAGGEVLSREAAVGVLSRSSTSHTRSLRRSSTLGTLRAGAVGRPTASSSGDAVLLH